MIQKALVVYRVDKNEPANIGVIKKLQGQVNGLLALGVGADYIIHDQSNIYLNNQRVYSRTPVIPDLYFKYCFFDFVPTKFKEKYDLIIIRYGLSTPSFIRWLQKIKIAFPQSYVLLDMPTFPYNQEWKGLKGVIAKIIDKKYLSDLKRYVDYVIHSGPHKSIFELSTIQIGNGIDLDDARIRIPQKHIGIKFLAVGKWSYWHGLDRFLKGMSKYKGDTQLDLTIVGEGPEITRLKKMTDRLGIKEKVTFSGIKTGKKLDDLFDQSDLGIGTLGLHRKDVDIDSSLKHREYVARGLPLILSTRDIDLSPDLEFVKYIDQGESDIDMGHVLRFIDQLNYDKVLEEMRNFATKNLSWQTKMKYLLEQIIERSEKDR